MSIVKHGAEKAKAVIERYQTEFNARLFPLRKRKLGDEGSKRPLVKNWQTRKFKAEKLVDYWAKGHAIGWALSDTDLVIDVDVPTEERPGKKGHESLKQLEKILGGSLTDETVEVVAPSGGRHFYLRKPAEVMIRKNLKTLPGIDFLSKGKYVVVAGSPHWQGGNYRFSELVELMGDYKRRVAPASLLEMLEKKTGAVESVTPDVKIPGDLLKQILDELPHDRYEDHDGEPGWFGIFAASHHATGGSAEGLTVFDEWSKGLTKYAKRNVRDRWPTLGNDSGEDRRTIATLFHELNDLGKKTVVRRVSSYLEFVKLEPDPQAVDLRPEKSRSDNANATRFIDDYGSGLRYVSEWKLWIVWDGRRWEVDIAGLTVKRLARRYAGRLWESFGSRASDLTSSLAGRIHSFLKATNSQKGISSFLNLAQADERVTISKDQLNEKPLLFNVENGTIDLLSGELREHRKEDYLTQLAPTVFDPSAESPEWEKFIQQILPAPGLAPYVKKICGYSISGDVSEHLLPIAYGTGANGKSVFWNTLIEIMGSGQYAAIASESLLLGNKNEHATEKADLYQLRFVAVSEPEQNSRLKESRVKELTGDDFIKGRRMKEDFWTFRRTHTFWLSSNHKPAIYGTDNGIWRRIKLIPFEVTIPREDQIPNLKKQLVESESSGILNWLLQGFREWREFGLEDPEVVKQAIAEYRTGEDRLGDFIHSDCIEAQNGESLFSSVYEAYQRWGGRLSNTNFSKRLNERGFETKTAKKKPNRDKKVIVGLVLRETDF